VRGAGLKPFPYNSWAAVIFADERDRGGTILLRGLPDAPDFRAAQELVIGLNTDES